MSQAIDSLIPTPALPASPPEYRRLAYRMFRMPGGYGRLRDTEWAYSGDSRPRLYQLPAWRAWQLASQFPSPTLARRYAEALR